MSYVGPGAPKTLVTPLFFSCIMFKVSLTDFGISNVTLFLWTCLPHANLYALTYTYF